MKCRRLVAFALMLSASIAVRADEPLVPARVGPSFAAEEDSPGHVFLDDWQPKQEPWPQQEPADTLPPLEVELHDHGGAYLYEPLDVNSELYRPPGFHDPILRLPESWKEPQPLAEPYEFLGSNFIEWNPRLSWFGKPGYQWEPRLVGYGGYQVFAALYEQGGTRRDGIGHQLLVDLDLALTGTERVHVQFRPIGEENSGGSYLLLSDPVGYDDNSTAIPQRWWMEGELQSLFGRAIADPTVQLDINYTAGKFPFALHNFLLINDEITGLVIGKNNITSTPLSNLNILGFYAFDEVDAYSNGDADLIGLHMNGDYRLSFLEFTVARAFPDDDSGRDASFLALSGTRFIGTLTLAGRMMFKIGDEDGRGDGQLYVLESNFTRRPSCEFETLTGIELAVAYLNVFHATEGWQPIAGGNFDRLRNLFALNPLLQIAAGRQVGDSYGAAIGVQLFRHHEDESFIPELAVEEVSSDLAWGVGLRYQRKLNARCFLDLRGLKTWSDFSPLQRDGVFASTTILF